MSADRERLRQELDDSVLMHTGRSVGDIASGRVVDDIWPIVQAIASAELRAAAAAPACEADRRKLRAQADRLDPK